VLIVDKAISGDWASVLRIETVAEEGLTALKSSWLSAFVAKLQAEQHAVP
jgi:hypothetical protein